MAQTVRLITDMQRAIACDVIRRAPLGHVVKVSPPKRTDDQNAKMWAMLSDLARAMPEGRRWTSETWKAAMMNALGHEIIWQPGIDGGTPFPAGYRTSRLSKAQMADLITLIYEYGDRHGVTWSEPHPDERASA